MFKSFKGPRLIAALGVLVLLVIGLITFQTNRPQEGQPKGDSSAPVPQSAQDQSDAAIQESLKRLQNSPADADIYQQIAVVYLNRAQRASGEQERWAHEGIAYIGKELSVRPPDNAHFLEVYGAARTLESLGDYSGQERCAAYRRALKLLEGEAPVLRHDTAMINGKPLTLLPLRKETDKALIGLRKKLTAAGCR